MHSTSLCLSLFNCLFIFSFFQFSLNSSVHFVTFFFLISSSGSYLLSRSTRIVPFLARATIKTKNGFVCRRRPSLDPPSPFNSALPPISGKESLNSSDYRQDTKLGFVVNSIYTVAHGLRSMQRQLCGSKKGICKGFLPVNGTILLQHLLNVNFQTYSGEKLHFNPEGDPPSR